MTRSLRLTSLALATTAAALIAGTAVGAPTAPTPPPAPPPTGAGQAKIMQPPPAPTTPACYELTAPGKAWSRTPELLCVDGKDKAATITLKTGMPPNPTEVAVFHLDLTGRVRCIDCNKDVYSLANPSNSVFNALQISFDGKRDVKAGTETGTLSIGKTKFKYRLVK